jgi:hypothetical protein
MRSKLKLGWISITVIALGACTSSAAAPSAATSTAAPVASQIAVATLTASAVPEASPSPTSPPSSADAGGGGGASATPNAIDPCDLLTVDEASGTIGKKLGAGVSTKLDKSRVCTFKSGLTELKVILAPPAPDAATAQAYWDAAKAEVPADIPIKTLNEFDRSAYGSGSAGGVSLSALFVIHGIEFFDLYCGFPSCPEAASVAAAKQIVSRLP